MKRAPISKSKRFSVFERDVFTCQYCGKTPPSVVLEIDHIIPVCEGGTGDIENLRTSCMECNRGKGAKILSAHEVNPMDRMRRLQEAAEDAVAAKSFAKAAEARDLLESSVTDHICKLLNTDNCKRSNIGSTISAIKEFGAEKVVAWLSRAASTCYGNENHMFKYFHGILRRTREEARE